MFVLLFACTASNGNQPPNVDEIIVTPEVAHNDSTLTCSATVSDPEDDLDEYYKSILLPRYQWRKGDEILNEKKKIQLANFELLPTETITCVVSVTDFRGLETEASLDVVIENRAPTISNIRIAPDDRYNDSELSCEADIVDLDEEVIPTYRWYSEGISLGTTKTITLAEAELQPGDPVQCSISVEDAYGESREDTVEITLQNRPPNTPDTTISWTLGGVLYPDGDSDVTCGTALVEDPDRDQLSYTAVWTNQDGIEVVGSRLFSNYTRSRDVWNCEMTVSDGELRSSATASVMIRDFDWERCGASEPLDGASHHFIGENEEDAAGYWVSAAGDIDGDGLGDVLVSAPNNDDGATNAGKVYVLLGSSLLSETIDLSQADYMFVGEGANDFAGLAVSSAGDVDGDGLDDILIGSRVNDDTGNNAGKTYLILAASLDPQNNVLALENADYMFVGEAQSDVSGWSVSSAGDIDGDGLDDIMISAIRARFGTETNVGKIYVFRGSSLGGTQTISLANADHIFIGEDVDDWAGSSISSAGDVDGDGLGDILIGADGNDHGGEWSGKAYLIFGASVDWSIAESSLENADYAFVGDEFDHAGTSVASAGDVDGDGLGDFLIGADGDYDGGFHAGKTYLVLGGSLGPQTIDLPDVDYAFVGEETDLAGSSVSAAGDVDGDGLDDILIGAPGNEEGGYAAGKIYVMRGASLGTINEIFLSNTDYGLVSAFETGLTGSSVSGVGDVNGDGISDVLIGVPNDNTGGEFAGKASLFTGCY